MTQANILAASGSQGVAQGFKNRIINGSMVIDQRNAGASLSTASGTSAYSLDRWQILYDATSKFTVQQNAGSVTPPVGFSNYLGVTSSSAYAVTASQLFCVRQLIEGFNTADLGWGTANAKTVTLSFQVYSSLTGTFGGSIGNATNTRFYPFSYSIPVANTWTTISVTIAGDTTGTWVGATNAVGISVLFGLGVGSSYSGTAGAWTGTANTFSVTGATSVVGTSGATFYITGVQLEVGSSATGFEYRQYGQELALCQRYFWKTYNPTVLAGATSGAGGQAGAVMIYVPAIGNTVRCTMPFKVNMRSSPTVTTYNPETGAATVAAYEGSGATNQVSLGVTFISDYSALIYATSAGFTGALYWCAKGEAEL